MNIFLRIVLGILGSLVALLALGWIGLQIPPRVVPLKGEMSPDLDKVRVPATLPAPVRRYLQVALGERSPRIETVAYWGRARANFGIWMLVRFHLYHRVGQDFRREMEVTWFGFPVLKALDQYINGQGMTGPVGKADTGEKVDQGSNMILFAEAALYPSLFVTDPRIRWQAIDETSARLFFPFGDTEDSLTIYFDPQTHLITKMRALRYRGQAPDKLPWRVDFQAWQMVDGLTIPTKIDVTWEDQGQPWSIWEFVGVAWNVDVSSVLPEANGLGLQKSELRKETA